MLLRMILSGGANIAEVLMYILSVLIITFFVTPLHECAHAWAALKLGDDTAKRQGRLTLNPIAHIDYLGALVLLLIGFGWARPVPIDSRHFKNPKRDMALSALAGPVSNLLAAVAAGLLRNTVITIVYKNGISILSSDGGLLYGSVWVWLILLFDYLTTINICLAVFNFIPIPPLDGSKILMAFLPDSAIEWLYQREQIFSMGLFIIIMLGGFDGILTSAQNGLYNVIAWLTSLPFSWAW